MKKNLVILLSVLFVLLSPVSWSQVDAPVGEGDRAPQRVVTFGCLLPLTGRYSVVGQKALKGILAAAEAETGGTRYNVIVKDFGESDRQLAVALAELLNTEGMTFIIGPIPSKYIGTISRGVNSQKIPAVVFPVSEDEGSGGPYIVKYYYPLEEQVRVLSAYAIRDLGVRRLAVLYPGTPFGKRLKQLFTADASENGGKIVYEGSYDPESRDISNEIGWIRSASPEAVFIPDGAASSAELILRLKREGKMRDVLFLGPSTWNSPLFLSLIGKEIDGFVYRAIFTDIFYYGDADWDEYANLTRDKPDEKPDVFGYQAYRAVKMMLSLD
ncbi:MAG TPA: penicillin-binding protein activator, partial [Thermodesulfobacteriota bacterium]|nr:penicillin-binding protein activator [Thermodesulfobacteriota bacterium]